MYGVYFLIYLNDQDFECRPKGDNTYPVRYDLVIETRKNNDIDIDSWAIISH